MSMVGGWVRPESTVKYSALSLGAVGGALGGVLLGVPHAAGAAAAMLLLVAYTLSHGSAVHRVSPRLAGAAIGLVALGTAFRLVGQDAAWTQVAALGTLALWGALGVMAATQWFDHRSTFGMAGFGIVASVVGAVDYAMQEVLGAYRIGTGFTAGWPGGETAGQWLVVPWRLAFMAALVWLAVSGAWLMTVHAKDRTAMSVAPGQA